MKNTRSTKPEVAEMDWNYSKIWKLAWIRLFWIFGLHWPSLAFLGLYRPWLAFLAFNDFFRLQEVFLRINQVLMPTFHQSDIENDYHSRFAKAVQSEESTWIFKASRAQARLLVITLVSDLWLHLVFVCLSHPFSCLLPIIWPLPLSSK